MSEATIPLSSLLRPSLSPDWKPAFTSEAREAMLREKVAALESEVADWKPEQPNYIPSAALPVIQPEFPRLRVRHDGKAAVEYIVVHNPAEDAPYATFYIRPMSELESLKAANVPERPAEEWQRRKKLAEKGKN